MTVHVSEIFIYPIKGTRPVAVDSIEIDENGLKGDRQFAIFRKGVRCSARDITEIMFIEARWRGSTLELSFPDTETFHLETSREGATGIEQFRGGETPVEDMGDDVANWLSAILSEGVRLCRIEKPSPFIIPLPEFTDVHEKDQQHFIDAAPVMLANAASLEDLNTRLMEPVEMHRFRPNVVVNGLPAYGEDEVAAFQFSEVLLKQVAPCERCKVVTMDLDTGKTAKEPLATLAAYRRRENDYAGGVMFGTYLSVGSSGVLAVGESMNS